MAEITVHEVPAVLAAVREVAEARVAPGAAEVDRTRSFPVESITALAEAGALGLMVPAEHGGAGGGLAALADACEVVGQADASAGMVFLMHAVTAATIAGGGGDRAADLLARMASGELLGTLAFSERGTGAHFYAPELRVERVGDSLRISGRKSFTTSGGHADVMLVLVQGEGDGLDCYAVAKDAEGVRFDGEWLGLGMAGNASVAVTFDGVAVSDEDGIGAPGS